LHNFEDQQGRVEGLAKEATEEAKAGNPPSSSGDFIMTEAGVLSDQQHKIEQLQAQLLAANAKPPTDAAPEPEAAPPFEDTRVKKRKSKASPDEKAKRKAASDATKTAVDTVACQSLLVPENKADAKISSIEVQIVDAETHDEKLCEELAVLKTERASIAPQMKDADAKIKAWTSFKDKSFKQEIADLRELCKQLQIKAHVLDLKLVAKRDEIKAHNVAQKQLGKDLVRFRAACLKINKTPDAGPVEPTEPSRAELIFRKLDRKERDSVDRRDFYMGLKRDSEIADFFGLPHDVTGVYRRCNGEFSPMESIHPHNSWIATKYVDGLPCVTRYASIPSSCD